MLYKYLSKIISAIIFEAGDIKSHIKF